MVLLSLKDTKNNSIKEPFGSLNEDTHDNLFKI